MAKSLEYFRIKQEVIEDGDTTPVENVHSIEEITIEATKFEMEDDDYLEHETEYSAMRDTSKANPVHHLQNSHSKMKNRLAVRKSQRTPKRKVIKSFGFVDEKKDRRVELSETTKELSAKKKIIQKKSTEQRQQLIGCTTSHIARVNKSQKRKHHEKSSNNFGTKRCHEWKPNEKIRYDQIAHFPNVDPEIKSRSRCKLEKCTYFSNIYCGKCNVHLCITTRRNCFKEFHIINTDTES